MSPGLAACYGLVMVCAGVAVPVPERVSGSLLLVTKAPQPFSL